MNKSLAIAIIVGLAIGLAAIFSQLFGNLLAMLIAGLALGSMIFVLRKYPNNYNARAVIAALGLVFLIAALVSIAGIALTIIGIAAIGVISFLGLRRFIR